jgi:hypothetical protein
LSQYAHVNGAQISSFNGLGNLNNISALPSMMSNKGNTSNVPAPPPMLNGRNGAVRIPQAAVAPIKQQHPPIQRPYQAPSIPPQHQQYADEIPMADAGKKRSREEIEAEARKKGAKGG